MAADKTGPAYQKEANGWALGRNANGRLFPSLISWNHKRITLGVHGRAFTDDLNGIFIGTGPSRPRQARKKWPERRRDFSTEKFSSYSRLVWVKSSLIPTVK